VKERTAALREKNDELERMNKMFVGRELRMVEIKKRLHELERKSGPQEKRESGKERQQP
jgi:hypothetical protein